MTFADFLFSILSRMPRPCAQHVPSVVINVSIVYFYLSCLT